MKEIEINDDLRGTAPEPYRLSKVVYDTDSERLSVYCANEKAFEFIKLRLQLYARSADGDPVEPRQFTANFKPDQNAILFTLNVSQAIDFLVAYELTTDALKSKIGVCKSDSTKATGDSRESGDTWTPGPSLWSGDAPDFSHHTEKTPLLNDQCPT